MLQQMKIPIQKFDLPLWHHFDVEFSLIRLDLTHPHVSGNKWFKLQPALKQARLSSHTPLLSFGGAYSNHLHALAYAACQEGLTAIAIIRGEEPSVYNPTLQDLKRWGMQLHFVSRAEYAKRYDLEYQEYLKHKFGNFQLIPEGGSSAEAVHACARIWDVIQQDQTFPDFLGCAMGTGATVSGLISDKPESVKVIAVPAIKVDHTTALAMLNDHWLKSDLKPKDGFQVLAGDLPYARISPMLAALWQRLFACYGVELDPVYTLRVYHRLSRMLLQGAFPRGTKVALLHTGGIQGLRGSIDRLSRLANVYHGPLPI